MQDFEIVFNQYLEKRGLKLTKARRYVLETVFELHEHFSAQDLYEKITVQELMYMPEFFISPNDSIEVIVEKFKSCGRYNLAVIDDGKYVGFISRARVFSVYRDTMADLSYD